MKVKVSEILHFPSGTRLERDIGVYDTENIHDIISLIHIGDTSNTNNIRVEKEE